METNTQISSEAGHKHKRRNFLLALGLGGLTAAAAALTGKPAQAAPAEEAAEPGAKKGYQLSEHVKRYYRSTRI